MPYRTLFVVVVGCWAKLQCEMGGKPSIEPISRFWKRKEHFTNFSSALDAASGGLGTSTCEITRTLFYLVFPSLSFFFLSIQHSRAFSSSSFFFFRDNPFRSFPSLFLRPLFLREIECSTNVNTSLRYPHLHPPTTLDCSSAYHFPILYGNNSHAAASQSDRKHRCPLVRQIPTLHHPT